MINSNTICPLPWIQLSVHLNTAMRFCCNTDNGAYVYHNNEQIFFEDLENINILDYYNSDTLRKLRKEMVSGAMPSLCDKCFTIEKNNGISIRQIFLGLYKKNENFHRLISATKEDGTLNQVSIQRLDFSMSNQCSLKCLMCNPSASTGLTKEFNTLELDYDRSFAQAASRKWNKLFQNKSFISRLSSNVQDILITGGEPLTNKTHKRLLEQLISLKLANQITLEYNTSGNNIDSKFFKLWKQFRHIYFHYSLDGKEKLNEYIRFGSAWSKIKKNLSRILEIKNASIEVHTCVMNINAAALPELYQMLLELPKKIAKLPHHIYVASPSHFSIQNLPLELKVKVRANIMSFLNKHSDALLSSPHQNWNARSISNIKGLLDLMDNNDTSPQEWKKFVDTILLHDNYRKNSLVDLLPYFQNHIQDYDAN